MDHDQHPDGVDRRDFLKTTGAVGTSVVAVSQGATAETDDQAGLNLAGGTSCEEDRDSDANLPFDTNGKYGGWGGHQHHGTDPGLDHYPIVFVHGNSRDACDFNQHAEYFLDRGYRGDALWSITFRETGSTHEMMRDQLDDFVKKILDYTGVNAIDVIGHSLGVTGLRYWMEDLNQYDRVDDFVGLAGANHGTETCGARCEPKPGNGRVCGFIALACADTPGQPLYELNHPDETPSDVDYYTIRGTADTFFPTRTDSPRLEGANENIVLDGATHDQVRTSDASKELMYRWVSNELPPDAQRQDS